VVRRQRQGLRNRYPIGSKSIAAKQNNVEGVLRKVAEGLAWAGREKTRRPIPYLLREEREGRGRGTQQARLTRGISDREKEVERGENIEVPDNASFRAGIVEK